MRNTKPSLGLGRAGLGNTLQYECEPPSPGHEREFVDAIKSRAECSCSFARHLPMHTALNLAHLSLQLGRKLHWDEAKWEVTGDPETLPVGYAFFNGVAEVAALLS